MKLLSNRDRGKTLKALGVCRKDCQNGTELLKRNTVSYVTMMECLQNFEEKLFPTRNYILSQEQYTDKNSICFHLNKVTKWHDDRIGTSFKTNKTSLKQTIKTGAKIP